MTYVNLNKDQIRRFIISLDSFKSRNNKTIERWVNIFDGFYEGHKWLIDNFFQNEVSAQDAEKFMNKEYNLIHDKAAVIAALQDYLYDHRPRHSYAYFKQNDWVYPILRVLKGEAA